METQTQMPPTTTTPPLAPMGGDAAMPPGGMQTMDNEPAEATHSKGPIMIILAVLLTALIVGGGSYFWQRSAIASVNETNATILTQSQAQVQELKTDLATVQASLDEALAGSDETQGIIDQLEMELGAYKVKFAMLDFWGVNNLVNDSKNPDHFYYANNFGGKSNIAVYNRADDEMFQAGEGYSFPSANTVLYSDAIGSQNEFILLNIVDDELIFVEQPIDSSPGPCYNLYLSDDLKSYNLGTQVVNESYTLPTAMRADAQTESDTCLAELNA